MYAFMWKNRNILLKILPSVNYYIFIDYDSEGYWISNVYDDITNFYAGVTLKMDPHCYIRTCIRKSFTVVYRYNLWNNFYF